MAISPEQATVMGEAGQQPNGVLAPDGSPREAARIDEPPELLYTMYRWMVFGRVLDARLISLQRQGRVITYSPITGQEAVQVGCALALQGEDWLLGSYRDGLACIVHGLPAEQVVLYFRGHPRAGAIPEGVNLFPMQIGVGEQIPHAVGLAWGMKLTRAATAALVLFGDGATSEGAFHEGANFAGVFKVPAVLVCQNNGWAISLPRARQTASETLAQKGVAYGIPGIQVDGNDVLAVYREVMAALEQARTGGGPTLIEALTYRTGPHTTADDPSRYRPEDETALWRDQRDPIVRLRSYMERQRLWDHERQQDLERETQEAVAQVVENALQEPAPLPETIFDHLYATLPPLVDEQRREVVARGGRPGTQEQRRG